MGLGISLLVTLPALDGISLFGSELSVLGPTAAGTAGLVGASIIDRILDSDDDDDDSSGGGGGGDGLMDDDGGDFGGMDDDFGGGDGGDDFGGMDDDFGGMDDDFGGGGGGGGGGADMDELEHQVDELENEVASLSSTVNTVKSENTEISDRIEDVEEDVRNLLDIYEMVTRGINPFVDEQDSSEFDVGGGGAGGGGGGLGLFDDGEDDSQQQDEDVDDSVMSEDADGFFDDDLAEEEDDDEFADDEFAEDDDEFADDEFGDELAEDDADEIGGEPESEEMVSDQDSTGGKSFSELKDEYDSGDASWAEEDGDEDDIDEMDDSFDEMDDGGDDLGGMDDSFDEMDDGGDDLGGMDDSFDEMDEEDDDLGGMDDSFGEMDDEPDETLGNGSEGSMGEATTEESTAPVEDTEASADSGFEYVKSDQLSSSGDKPYLTSIPGDYVGDLVVMEWLEFLVEESNVTDAARAVNYYERIDWIDPPVADHLRSFLSGFGDIDRNKVDRPGTDQLTRTHHVHSLKYIMKLNNGTTATSVILDRWDTFAQGDDGL